MRGLQPGDVYRSADGWLNVIVRQVKQQPERRLFPAHLRIPVGSTPGHCRSRALAAFTRADALLPGWYTYVSARLKDVTRTDGQAAGIIGATCEASGESALGAERRNRAGRQACSEPRDKRKRKRSLQS